MVIGLGGRAAVMSRVAGDGLAHLNFMRGRRLLHSRTRQHRLERDQANQQQEENAPQGQFQSLAGGKFRRVQRSGSAQLTIGYFIPLRGICAGNLLRLILNVMAGMTGCCGVLSFFCCIKQ